MGWTFLPAPPNLSPPASRLRYALPFAVMLNRVRAAGFPDTLPAVTAGLLASQPGGAAEYSACIPDGRSMRAAAAALRGGDPTRGALYFAESGDVPDDIRESGRILFEASGFAFWK